jgi:hypothetical protein
VIRWFRSPREDLVNARVQPSSKSALKIASQFPLLAVQSSYTFHPLDHFSDVAITHPSNMLFPGHSASDCSSPTPDAPPNTKSIAGSQTISSIPPSSQFAGRLSRQQRSLSRILRILGVPPVSTLSRPRLIDDRGHLAIGGKHHRHEEN